MKNYLMLKGFSLFSQNYVFVDTRELLYIRLFRDAGIKVKETWEYAKEGSGLRLIICRILKKDRQKFEDTVISIRNKALLMGHSDYDEACEMLQGMEEGEDND